MLNFNAQKAAVSEMREYAGCVDALYLSEIGPYATIAPKVLFVIALVSFVVGFMRARKHEPQLGLGDHLLMGLTWFIIAPCSAAFASGVLYGIRWLFT